MGYYLNNSDAYTMYKNECSKPFFIDKSMLLRELFPLVEQGNHYICITRPRRFGKTVMANMIGSFFSSGCSSEDIFDHLRISGIPEYQKHRNRHNVIYIDFSKCDDACDSYHAYISNIKELLREDLHEAWPDISFRKNGTVSEDLKRINQKTGEVFLFVLDEWDAVFHMSFVNAAEQKKYLLFLKDLLKDQAYVSFAYMTGILPITKYSSGSELNMFLEYSMATQERFSEYFGFTEKEVDQLFERYLKICPEPEITRDGLREWYDGYHTRSGEQIYNPRSVVAALSNNSLMGYWTSSGPYDEIYYYVRRNVSDVRDELAVMIGGEAVPARIQEYAAASMDLQTKDEIFSAMVVYGFLSYENGRVKIPNRELMNQFADMIQKEESLGYLNRLSRESDRMLKATLSGDTETMSEILAYVHDTETPLLSYNHEAELSAIVTLAYLSARDQYKINKNDSGIILELKVDHTPEEAVQQIKDHKYALRFAGKPGEEPQYTGKVLAVGIGYDRKEKTLFERLVNKISVLPFGRTKRTILKQI